MINRFLLRFVSFNLQQGQNHGCLANEQLGAAAPKLSLLCSGCRLRQSSPNHSSGGAFPFFRHSQQAAHRQFCHKEPLKGQRRSPHVTSVPLCSRSWPQTKANPQDQNPVWALQCTGPAGACPSTPSLCLKCNRQLEAECAFGGHLLTDKCAHRCHHRLRSQRAESGPCFGYFPPILP